MIASKQVGCVAWLSKLKLCSHVAEGWAPKQTPENWNMDAGLFMLVFLLSLAWGLRTHLVPTLLRV